MTHITIFPPEVFEGFNFSTSCKTYLFFNNSYLSRREVIFYCGFDFHFI